MPEGTKSFSKRRTVGLAISLVTLFGLWYAFRPEKLFVNKRVDEPPPATLTRLTPLYTGSFRNGARETSGRATVYQQANGGRVLTLSNLSTPDEPELDLILIDANSIPKSLDFAAGLSNSKDIGRIEAGKRDQSYALPADTDIGRFNTAAIYSPGLHAVFGTARLDAF